MDRHRRRHLSSIRPGHGEAKHKAQSTKRRQECEKRLWKHMGKHVDDEHSLVARLGQGPGKAGKGRKGHRRDGSDAGGDWRLEIGGLCSRGVLRCYHHLQFHHLVTYHLSPTPKVFWGLMFAVD